MTEIERLERPSATASYSPGRDVVKRVLDVAIALVVIIVLSPVIAVLALLIRLTSSGPALFRQERLGQGERSFTLMKLRTMQANNDDRIHREYIAKLLTEEEEPPALRNGLYKLDRDPRITTMGAWLRATSLDELPQLFNVLRGEMSLVGPRPVLSWEADMFQPADRERFEVKPGITGLWQVSGRNKLTFREALALDVEYVRRRSTWLDLSILVRTAPAVLRDRAR
jgi:lipopolysaccharide/colanic/teichoic acid biosynthesis glycosyltransferase